MTAGGGTTSRLLAALVACVMVFGACAPESDDARVGRADAEASGGDDTGGAAGQGSAKEGSYPGPEAKVPAGPAKIAAELKRTRSALARDVDDWLDQGTIRNATARRIALGALWDQRLARHLAQHPAAAKRVFDRIHGALAVRTKRNYSASGGLTKLVTPVKKIPKWKTYAPSPPHKLRRYYGKAERRFGVKWYYLASINLVETRMGRILGPSSAGARGPMQFIPSTWDAYGKGDIDDPHDAIMAAARYLSASGAPERMRDALYSYNHSDAYVNAITSYARVMKDDPDQYYVYYYWQVFVRTTRGDKQLTGPGT